MSRFQSRSNLQRATSHAQQYQRRISVAERNRELARLQKQAAEERKREEEAQRAALANHDGEVIPDSTEENHP